MLRNILRYFCGLTLALMGGAGFVSCSDDNNGLELPQEQLAENDYITLSLKCVEGTRAPEESYTEPGVEGLNENWIEKVTICLWMNDGTKPDPTAKPDYVQTFTEVNRNNVASFRIPLTLALKQRLFETSGATCHAFAAVNVDIPEEEFTIADLRRMTVESAFSNRKRQDYFTMDGDCAVIYDPTYNSAKGNIELQRSASKITLALDVDNIVEQTAVVEGKLVTSNWKADKSAMRVWLKGGLAQSTLDPNLTDFDHKAIFDTPDNLNYSFIPNTAGEGNTPDNGNNPPENGDTENPGKRTYPYIQDVPFYTYPHRWTAEPDDKAATYMILSIPWEQVDDNEDPIPNSTVRTCYYQVPVIAENSELLQLVRNVSYHIYLHVGLLGSFDPDVPLVLDQELEYSAAEWGNVDIDVSIPNVRYLVVDQNDYTVNNEPSIAIPFYTSHKTVVTDATMTFYRFNYTDAGLQHPVEVNNDINSKSYEMTRDSVFNAYFDNKQKVLHVIHDLYIYEAYDRDGNFISFTQGDNKDMGMRPPQGNSSTKAEDTWKTNIQDIISYLIKKETNGEPENEYSKVEFKITLQHEDLKGSNNFKEVITITQYPGIYIEAIPNYYGGTTTTAFSCTGIQGNTFINGNNRDLGNSNLHYLNGDTGSNSPSGGFPQGYSRQDGWMTSIGLYSTSSYFNYNPNMYLITVTSLPVGTPYKIGNPRSNYINNYLGSTPLNGVVNTEAALKPLENKEDTRVWDGTTYSYNYGNNPMTTVASGFRNGKAIYPNESERKLSYYYPTIEDEEHKMMIAPKIRVCSSYAGTTWILNRELARRRAAAYQELGYAAGRWRLPTFGEVSFLMDLASEYKIPRLFGAPEYTWWYWCANGLVTVPSKNSGDKASIPNNADGYEPPAVSMGAPEAQRARFVYDEWYWGEANLPHSGTIGSADCVYTFTWGDRPY